MKFIGAVLELAVKIFILAALAALLLWVAITAFDAVWDLLERIA